MLHRTMIFAWQGTFLPNTSFVPQAPCICGPNVSSFRLLCSTPPRVAGLAGRRQTMDLATRLNALAALMSFGFIAAIVFGLV